MSMIEKILKRAGKKTNPEPTQMGPEPNENKSEFTPSARLVKGDDKTQPGGKTRSASMSAVCHIAELFQPAAAKMRSASTSSGSVRLVEGIQESRDSAPSVRRVEGIQESRDQQGGLLNPNTPGSPDSESIYSMSTPTGGAVTATARGLVVRPKTRSSPPTVAIPATAAPPNSIDVTSPAGQRLIAALKHYFSLRGDEPAGRLYAFYRANGAGIEQNWVRIVKHENIKRGSRKSDGGKKKDTSKDGSGGYVRHGKPTKSDADNYWQVLSDPSVWPVNITILDHFDSLLWSSFINTENDVPRPPRRVVRGTDEDWVSAARIRTIEALPKYPARALPRDVTKYLPATRSRLRTLTVIVDAAEAQIPLSTSDRFNRFICADDDDCHRSNFASGWPAATASSFGRSPAAAASSTVTGPISYHSARGAQILLDIQEYLARPAGELPHETSHWIDQNRGLMQSVRAGDIRVILPEEVQADVEAGVVEEDEAQEGARKALKEAMATLDWDEIDDEPVI